jgi:hypothetical protein
MPASQITAAIEARAVAHMASVSVRPLPCRTRPNTDILDIQIDVFRRSAGVAACAGEDPAPCCHAFCPARNAFLQTVIDKHTNVLDRHAVAGKQCAVFMVVGNFISRRQIVGYPTLASCLAKAVTPDTYRSFLPGTARFGLLLRVQGRLPAKLIRQLLDWGASISRASTP